MRRWVVTGVFWLATIWMGALLVLVFIDAFFDSVAVDKEVLQILTRGAVAPILSLLSMLVLQLVD